jgi:hypothetical protein
MALFKGEWDKPYTDDADRARVGCFLLADGLANLRKLVGSG